MCLCGGGDDHLQRGELVRGADGLALLGLALSRPLLQRLAVGANLARRRRGRGAAAREAERPAARLPLAIAALADGAHLEGALLRAPLQQRLAVLLLEARALHVEPRLQQLGSRAGGEPLGREGWGWGEVKRWRKRRRRRRGARACAHVGVGVWRRCGREGHHHLQLGGASAALLLVELAQPPVRLGRALRHRGRLLGHARRLRAPRHRRAPSWREGLELLAQLRQPAHLDGQTQRNR